MMKLKNVMGEAVHPNFRHKGIEAMLVEKATQALTELGIKKVAFVVFDKNENLNFVEMNYVATS